MAINSNAPLIATKAPNLPIAPVDYRQSYLDQLTNAIRLYFAQVDNFTQASVNPNYGSTADRPIQSVQVPLPVGSTYFDTTINKPIFWNGMNWINAAGTVV